MLLSTTATKIAKSYNSAQFKRSLFISTFRLNLVELVLKEINKKRRLKTHKIISCDAKKNAFKLRTHNKIPNFASNKRKSVQLKRKVQQVDSHRSINENERIEKRKRVQTIVTLVSRYNAEIYNIKIKVFSNNKFQRIHCKLLKLNRKTKKLTSATHIHFCGESVQIQKVDVNCKQIHGILIKNLPLANSIRKVENCCGNI